MGTYQLIKNLARDRGVSIAKVEKEIGLSNGSMSKWDTYYPNSRFIVQVADYFDVSVDYLLGRSTYQKDTSITASAVNIAEIVTKLTDADTELVKALVTRLAD